MIQAGELHLDLVLGGTIGIQETCYPALLRYRFEPPLFVWYPPKHHVAIICSALLPVEITVRILLPLGPCRISLDYDAIEKRLF